MAAGIAPGDRVDVWAVSQFEWVLAQFATARIGAILEVISQTTRCKSEGVERSADPHRLRSELPRSADADICTTTRAGAVNILLWSRPLESFPILGEGRRQSPMRSGCFTAPR